MEIMKMPKRKQTTTPKKTQPKPILEKDKKEIPKNDFDDFDEFDDDDDDDF